MSERNSFSEFFPNAEGLTVRCRCDRMARDAQSGFSARKTGAENRNTACSAFARDNGGARKIQMGDDGDVAGKEKSGYFQL